MEKKTSKDLKSIEIVKDINREYMHSISRISDRLNVLKRDLKNIREDINRDLADMEEDLHALSNAIDSIFGDHLSKIHDENKKHEVEEI